jgi:hypothetical protein
MGDHDLDVLEKYLLRVPGISSPISKGYFEDGKWWVKFSIDIHHDLAWHVVQELGYVLNGLSVGERLPTVFMPISPPPYLNGGPEDYLSWAIESQSNEFSPALCAQWLEGRLPRPVEDEAQWPQD